MLVHQTSISPSTRSAILANYSEYWLEDRSFAELIGRSKLPSEIRRQITFELAKAATRDPRTHQVFETASFNYLNQCKTATPPESEFSLITDVITELGRVKSPRLVDEAASLVKLATMAEEIEGALLFALSKTIFGSTRLRRQLMSKLAPLVSIERVDDLTRIAGNAVLETTTEIAAILTEAVEGKVDKWERFTADITPQDLGLPATKEPLNTTFNRLIDVRQTTFEIQSKREAYGEEALQGPEDVTLQTLSSQLQLLLEKLAVLVGATGSAFLVYYDHEHYFGIDSSYNFTVNSDTQSIALGSGAIGNVGHSVMPLILNDISSQNDLGLALNHYGSILCYPLVTKTHLCGTLLLVCEEPDHFYFEHLVLLSFVINEVAEVCAPIWELRNRTTLVNARQILPHAAHIFKTPVSNLVSYSDEMVSRVLDPEQIKLNARILRDEARSLNGLVTSILDISRLEAGLPLQAGAPAPIDLCQAVRVAIERLWVSAKFGDVSLGINLDGGSGLQVLGDQQRLVESFTNVVANAIKHSPTGGTVVVTATLDDGHAVITVEDEGDGVPHDEAETIFRMFYSGKNRKQDSTGLGLTYANTILRHYGGSITYQPGPVKGAIFRMSIPLYIPID